MTLTVKRVYRFSTNLDTGCDAEDICDQTLLMRDNRTVDVRALYKDAIYDFFFYLDRAYVNDRYMPPAHLATVLLKMHSDLLANYHSKKKGPKAVYLTDDKKNNTPALILSEFKHSDFLNNRVEKETDC